MKQSRVFINNKQMNKQASYILLVLIILSFTEDVSAQSACTPINLKCEYLINPLGIDEEHPRLLWQLNDKRRGALQTAYQILVSSDSLQLLKGKANEWNSGKINSNKTSNIEYKGIPLQSRKKYFWKVIVWDKDGKPSSASSIATFETGIYNLREWKGEWISDSNDVNYKPAPYFRKNFTAKAPIKNARAYICGLGYYELSINGGKVGNDVLSPAYTRYDKTVFYLTYDLTSYLNSNENGIGVLLGNGWYNEQSKAVWYFDKAPWRERPKFLMNVYVEYADGTTDLIVSDTSWKTSPSPVIFNNIYSGEYYDARLEQKGWNETGFDDSKWKHASYCMPQAGKLKSQLMPPIRITREIKPVSVKKINDTVYVFDLGQNFTGLSRLFVSGERGTTIYLKHGEDLTAQNGTRLNQKNISVHYRFEDSTEAAQTDRFILKGEGIETFTQHFTCHGYRYVEVTSDKPIRLDENSLTGLVIHTDVKRIGSFSCSNELLNKIYTAGIWSYISNMQGIPTDCPQREKNGWTGDGHISAEVGLYNFDAILFYEKWIGDFIDEQRASGEVPGIIPSSGWGYTFGNGPVWDAALLLIPDYLYEYYGDDHLIKKYYEHYKRYVDYLSFRADSNNIQHIGLGDWSPYKTRTPIELTSTLYYYNDALLLSKFAHINGIKEDENYYAQLAEKIKASINKNLFDKQTGMYANGSQTALSSALFMRVVPNEYKNKVVSNLVNEVAKNDNHLNVGMIGSKTLLNALTQNGRNDIAYKIASQQTRPSWGWWLLQGETTFQEGWGLGPSRNHIFLGEIVAWFYKALAGINVDPSYPGYKNIIITPNFVDSLSYVTASTESIYGTIKSSWQRLDDYIKLNITIPANTIATMYLPKSKEIYENNVLLTNKNAYIKYISIENEMTKYKLISGEYNFDVK
jgi:alpha-L-rhamnosidase